MSLALPTDHRSSHFTNDRPATQYVQPRGLLPARILRTDHPSFFTYSAYCIQKHLPMNPSHTAGWSRNRQIAGASSGKNGNTWSEHMAYEEDLIYLPK